MDGWGVVSLSDLRPQTPLGEGQGPSMSEVKTQLLSRRTTL